MISRATSGDLDLQFDRRDPRVRAGLESALRDAVRTGRLRPGLRLPSSRVLARDLGVARNTVAEAFAQLVAEGWLTARHGSGTWVRDRRTSPGAPSPATDRLATARPTARPIARPIAGPDTGPDAGPVPETGRAPRYDLRAGSPDLSGFPRTAWLAAARTALATAPHDVLGYGHPLGLPVLRAALADYLARARGVLVDPDGVLVCSGFAQGLDLVGRVLRARGGRTLAVEAYGHELHRRSARENGLRPVPVPVDGLGARVDDVPAGPGGAPAGLLLTPAHQFPLGVVLHPDRRRRAVDLARDRELVVIEDDYDGEFRYDRQPVGALQALAPDCVVYAGTASKSLAPGLRLGWLVPPRDLLDDLVATQRTGAGTCSVVDQLTLAELIRTGRYDHHVRAIRLRYRRRRDALVTALAERAPAVRVTGIAAGLHAVVRLPPGSDEDEAVARAARHGVAVQGLRTFTVPGHELPPALVVGYGTPPEHAVTGALAALASALAG